MWSLGTEYAPYKYAPHIYTDKLGFRLKTFLKRLSMKISCSRPTAMQNPVIIKSQGGCQGAGHQGAGHQKDQGQQGTREERV